MAFIQAKGLVCEKAEEHQSFLLAMDAQQRPTARGAPVRSEPRSTTGADMDLAAHHAMAYSVLFQFFSLLVLY